jgi:cysteine desulfurase
MEAYFDNSATTKVSERVISLMEKTMREDYGNPSAKHMMGVRAEQYVKDAAEKIARTMKVSAKDILFTSGGTESDNLALIGCALANKRNGKHIISTGVEHPAVYEPLSFLESFGLETTILGVDRNGHIDLDELKNAIRPDTVLVSVMHVNNEVGAVEPVEEIAKIVHGKNSSAYFHVDAIQSYGKLRIYPERMGIDLLSVSGHKLHGPKGVGFLYISPRVKIKPILYGGGQQNGMRSGTVNVPGIAGLGEAAAAAYENFDEKIARMISLKDRITDGVLTVENVTVNSRKGSESAPQIVSISVKGVKSEVLLHALEEKHIYVSSGSACSSHHPGISGTLKGIGLEDDLLDSTIRVSLSDLSTGEEADYFLGAFRELVPILRKFTRH